MNLVIFLINSSSCSLRPNASLHQFNHSDSSAGPANSVLLYCRFVYPGFIISSSRHGVLLVCLSRAPHPPFWPFHDFVLIVNIGMASLVRQSDTSPNLHPSVMQAYGAFDANERRRSGWISPRSPPLCPITREQRLWSIPWAPTDPGQMPFRAPSYDLSTMPQPHALAVKRDYSPEFSFPVGAYLVSQNPHDFD